MTSVTVTDSGLPTVRPASSAEGVAMTQRDLLTLTLRARSASDDLIPGTLMASSKGRVVYRILEVTHVRRAGKQGCRVRIVCARVSRADVPEGAKLRQWPRDERAPHGHRRANDRPRCQPIPARRSRRQPASRASAPRHRSCWGSSPNQFARPKRRQKLRSWPGHDASVGIWAWSTAATTAPAFGWKRSVRATVPSCAMQT